VTSREPVADPVRRTGVLFDLDGTLVDSVYQHVLAWRAAFADEGLDVAVWKIHRRIGMSGGLFARALLGETHVEVTAELGERLQQRHREAYSSLAATVRRLPGSDELLAKLTELGVPWAIATSSGEVTAARTMSMLTMPAEVPVITRDRVQRAKPDPDLFLAAAARLEVPIESAVVVGDSIWDMLAATRCHALGVGLLSGGYGPDELRQAGAIRVYEDPADLLLHIDEVGGRR
jgi:HAD superfamily hydrolase (TIGR01509 family)